VPARDCQKQIAPIDHVVDKSDLPPVRVERFQQDTPTPAGTSRGTTEYGCGDRMGMPDQHITGARIDRIHPIEIVRHDIILLAQFP
jgi:hypothetical protein